MTMLYTATMIAVMENERFAREMAGLVSPRPGGPIQLYGEDRGISDAASGGTFTDDTMGAGPDTTGRKPWTFTPEYGG